MLSLALKRCKAVPFQLIRESFGVFSRLSVAAAESAPLCSTEPRGRVQAGDPKVGLGMEGQPVIQEKT